MNLAVFGAGYVGCVSAACFARMGHLVRLVEEVPWKVEALRKGECPLSEPGLASEIRRWVAQGRLVPTASPAEAVSASEVSILCVGTPSLPDGRPDLLQIRKVLDEITKSLVGGTSPHVIVIRSTVPYPHVASEVIPHLAASLGPRWGTDVFLALNPEFLRESSALADFFDPPFVVVGTEHAAAAETLRVLYSSLNAPFRVVSPGTASLLKYACNGFHSLKVSFANEIASLAAVFHADPVETMRMFCEDRSLNLSPAYLRPGYAYGGSCLPKDLRALRHAAAGAGIPTPLLESLPRSNAVPVEQAITAVASFGLRRVLLVGLSFKRGTDDLRESPWVDLAKRLLGEGYDLRIYDPDVRIEQLHGRNLQYVEQQLAHLGRLLVPDGLGAVTEGTLVVIGKASWERSEIEDLGRRGQPVLDLTRSLSPDVEGLRLYQCDGSGIREVLSKVHAA